MNEYIVLGIVFIAVLTFAVALITIFGMTGGKTQKDNLTAVDDPVRRFIEPEDLQRIRYSSALVAGLLGLAVAILSGFYWGLLFVLALAYIAYCIPWWHIQRKIRKRNQEFESGMLDFTILISNTLRAGIALPAAIEMAIETIGGAMREEFTVVLREHRLGLDLADSIDRMTKRIESENLQLFSATVCVTMRTGGSMADVLDHVVITIRQRAAFQDKLKSRIAQSEFEAFAVSLTPIAAFVVLYLIDSDLMTPVLTTSTGWIAICSVIILETIGFFVLKHVTRVDF